MDLAPNPFVVPEAAGVAPRSDPDATAPEGPWRSGRSIMARSGAPWPRRCLRCNSPDVGPAEPLSLGWTPRWALALLLLGPIPYLIGHLFLRQRGRAEIHLCAVHLGQRRFTAPLLPVGLVLLAVGGMALAAAADQPRFLLVPLAALCAVFVVPMSTLWARSIRGPWLELGGASQAFRDSLPAFSAAQQMHLDTGELDGIDP